MLSRDTFDAEQRDKLHDANEKYHKACDKYAETLAEITANEKREYEQIDNVFVKLFNSGFYDKTILVATYKAHEKKFNALKAALQSAYDEAHSAYVAEYKKYTPDLEREPRAQEQNQERNIKHVPTVFDSVDAHDPPPIIKQPARPGSGSSDTPQPIPVHQGTPFSIVQGWQPHAQHVQQGQPWHGQPLQGLSLHGPSWHGQSLQGPHLHGQFLQQVPQGHLWHHAQFAQHAPSSSASANSHGCTCTTNHKCRACGIPQKADRSSSQQVSSHCGQVGQKRGEQVPNFSLMTHQEQQQAVQKAQSQLSFWS